MKLYQNINTFCNSYSIPLNSNTIGYLQFYTEFSTTATDIITVKSYILNAFGTKVLIHPFNIIIQKNATNTMRILVQGLNITTAFNNEPFRFEFDLEDNFGNTIYLYSDLFKFDLCDNSDVLIPCLVDGQVSQYNYINDFVGNIVYNRWLINSEKKYTPVIFLRNVAFNLKSTTTEFKKVNNRPLYATNKKNHFLRSELIPQEYIEVFDEVFSFGKVQIKGVVYNLDTYSIDVIDDKDNCSWYKPNITAYEEYRTRINCSNTCVVLSPINCNSYSNATKNINITFDLCNFDLVQNITSYFQDIGYEIGDCDEFEILNSGQDAEYICDDTGYYLEYSEVPPYPNELLVIKTTICNVETLININLTYNKNCFDDCFDCECFWDVNN